MDPMSQVAELIEAAAGKSSEGTICAIIAENVGPLKALMAPVAAITEQMNAAMVQDENLLSANDVDKKIKINMQATYSRMHLSNSLRFSLMSI